MPWSGPRSRGERGRKTDQVRDWSGRWNTPARGQRGIGDLAVVADRSPVGMDRWLVHMSRCPRKRLPDWPGLSENRLDSSSPFTVDILGRVQSQQSAEASSHYPTFTLPSSTVPRERVGSSSDTRQIAELGEVLILTNCPLALFLLTREPFVNDRPQLGAQGLDFKAPRKSDPEGSDAGVTFRTEVTTASRFWAVAEDSDGQATVQVLILFVLNQAGADDSRLS
ncbi:hypothetical protein B0I37DRAFT_209023 [Chaetomium sp. MPI-CAGE-AT-0009]|nr:hypothetical protein B0I37DRAFT_209023 [Chaetomium sp. MPI-CAGE-AT-0009]